MAVTLIALVTGFFGGEFNFYQPGQHIEKWFGRVFFVLLPLPIFNQLFLSMVCNYEENPPTLYALSSLNCWETLHIIQVTCAIALLLPYYLFVSVAAPSFRTDPDVTMCAEQGWYAVTVVQLKLAMSGASVFLGEHDFASDKPSLWTMLIVLLLFNSYLLFCNFRFEPVVSHTVATIRKVGFLLSTWSVVCSIITAIVDDRES